MKAYAKSKGWCGFQLWALMSLAGLLGFLPDGSSIAHAEDNTPKPVLVNFDDHNAPVMYQENGAAKGLYPEIVSEVFRRLNKPYSFNAIPWNRALSEAYSDRAGVGGVYWSQERATKLDYSAPIYVEKLLVYVRPEHKFVFSKIEDLKGKKLAVTIGTVYGIEFDEAKAKGSLITEENLGDTQNFEKLAQGRVDAVIASEIAGSTLLRQTKLTDKIVALSHPVSVLTVHVAFAKGKHLELIGQINKQLAALRADGSLEKLSKKYNAQR
ncbi:MAG: transporter substrate-binding domain-containing protein [Deltaproteobacteria bacterium]|nr:transporter substrate-binding domain-containing protein [Deltaproteobacteria bacterium]